MCETAQTPAACRVGVDLTVIADVTHALERHGDRYARRLFTDHELASAGDGANRSAASLAARFAAKEAVVKVLAPSGARPAWRDIEVRRRPSGACTIALYGRAAALASARGLGHLSVSLSHEAGVAVAVVVADAGVRCADPALSTDHTMESASKTRSQPMTNPETAQRVRAVLADHARLPVDVASLADGDDLFQAGMTSHASVNVMLALEDALDVEFPEALLRKSTFSSVASLSSALDALREEVSA